jgi:hypothetical protein
MTPTEIKHDPVKQVFQVGGHKITYGRPLYYLAWVVWCVAAVVTPGLLALFLGAEYLTLYIGSAFITIVMGDDHTCPVKRDAWSLEAAFKKAKDYARRIDLTNVLVEDFNAEQKETTGLLE